MIDEKEKSVSKDSDLSGIAALRICVGYLGEKEHQNWWPSAWLSANAHAFLSPVYGKRTNVAQLHGLTESARRVHDSRIGVGRAYHLFRLPEAIERQLHDAMTEAASSLFDTFPSSAEEAESKLKALASASGQLHEGPVRVGKPSDLLEKQWLSTVAAHYLGAFQANKMTFPYFAEAA